MYYIILYYTIFYTLAHLHTYSHTHASINSQTNSTHFRLIYRLVNHTHPLTHTHSHIPTHPPTHQLTISTISGWSTAYWRPPVCKPYIIAQKHPTVSSLLQTSTRLSAPLKCTELLRCRSFRQLTFTRVVKVNFSTSSTA